MATDTPYFGPAHREKYESHWQDALPILMGKLRTGKLDSGDVTRLLGNNDRYGSSSACDTDLDTLSNGLRALPVKERVALANQGLEYASSMTGFNLLVGRGSRSSRGGGPTYITSNVGLKIGVLLDNGGDPNVLLDSFVQRSATSCLSSTTVKEGLAAIVARPEVAARIRPEMADKMLKLVDTIDQKTACEFPIRYSFSNFMRSISPFTAGYMEDEFKMDNSNDAEGLKKFIPRLLEAGGRYKTNDGQLEAKLVNGVMTTSPLAIAASISMSYHGAEQFLKNTGSLGDHPVTAMRALDSAYLPRIIDQVRNTGVTFNEQDAQKKTILHHLLERFISSHTSPQAKGYETYYTQKDLLEATKAILKIPGIDTALKDEKGVSVASLLRRTDQLVMASAQEKYDTEKAALDKNRAELDKSYAALRVNVQPLAPALAR